MGELINLSEYKKDKEIQKAIDDEREIEEMRAKLTEILKDIEDDPLAGYIHNATLSSSLMSDICLTTSGYELDSSFWNGYDWEK